MAENRHAGTDGLDRRLTAGVAQRRDGQLWCLVRRVPARRWLLSRYLRLDPVRECKAQSHVNSSHANWTSGLGSLPRGSHVDLHGIAIFEGETGVAYVGRRLASSQTSSSSALETRFKEDGQCGDALEIGAASTGMETGKCTLAYRLPRAGAPCRAGNDKQKLCQSRSAVYSESTLLRRRPVRTAVTEKTDPSMADLPRLASSSQPAKGDPKYEGGRSGA